MNTMRNILILVDDRGFFYSSTREVGGSMDVIKIKKKLNNLGYNVEVKKFYEINFSESYKNIIILYQSTEDPDLKYKGYIEDILLGLKNSGAILVPGFEEFRAHHNKVFMEVLRNVKGLNKKTNMNSRVYGTLEEFIEDKENHDYPLVIKSSFGSRASGVYKANSENEAIRKIKKISQTPTFINSKRAIKSLFNKYKYIPISNFRNKFIVQNYIPNLKGDYKILVYGNKYYPLERKNRKRDFRASGSGLFSFPKEVPLELLEYTLEVFNLFRVPFASFDIARNNDKFYLMEFQFISFGQYSLEKSNFYYRKNNNTWDRVHEKSDLENVFSEAVDRHLVLYES
jgi:glutathione synthase/RimK-type ligase-like ATP-grasp enzyme